MKKIKLLLLITTFIFTTGVVSQAQSRKAQQLYKHYEAQPNAKIKEIPKSFINLGMAFVKTDASVKTVLNDLDKVKILTIKSSENLSDLEHRLPGKKYNFNVEALNKDISIWAKRCLFRVKEIHLVYETKRKTMLISAFGNFKIKDLKEFNKNVIQKGDLKNLPFLSSL